MIITILTTGTRGDTQPYIALGLELQKAGHHVRLAAFETFENFIKSFGLEFCRVQGDVTKIASGEIGDNAMRADNPLKLLLSFRELQALVFDVQQDFFDACRGANAIVYHPGAAIGYFAAQHFGVPSILAAPFPMIPTREYPSLIFYDKARLGKTFNLLTHKVFEQIMWSASRSPIRQFWKREFGRAPDPFSNPFRRQNTRRFPTIVSCSNHVFAQPRDGSPHVHHTGYWLLEEEPGWTASPDLLDFLQKGTPPVYVGFGSTGAASTAPHITELVIEALRRTGQRGLLATGWGGLSRKDGLPDHVFVLGSAPHSWLFPQMAAVVHHGGAGTTAAGLRAGAPTVIISGGNDTLAWGRRVYELGVGPKPIPRKNLSVENLAESIRSALTQQIRDQASLLGSKLQKEKGAEIAAQVILDSLQLTG